MGGWCEMNEGGTREMFPLVEDESTGPRSESEDANILAYRRTGTIPAQWLRSMIDNHTIIGVPEIEPDQIQPASLDLRLGRNAYRVRASFLPGKSTVMEKVRQLDGEPAMYLTAGQT